LEWTQDTPEQVDKMAVETVLVSTAIFVKFSGTHVIFMWATHCMYTSKFLSDVTSAFLVNYTVVNATKNRTPCASRKS
jgi:hypothetical protein